LADRQRTSGALITAQKLKQHAVSELESQKQTMAGQLRLAEDACQKAIAGKQKMQVQGMSGTQPTTAAPSVVPAPVLAPAPAPAPTPPPAPAPPAEIPQSPSTLADRMKKLSQQTGSPALGMPMPGMGMPPKLRDTGGKSEAAIPSHASMSR
jgi:hypothetical protein